MAAAKYVALQDFGDFHAGDPVPASKVEDADQLVAAGMIKLAEDETPKDPGQPSTPTTQAAPPTAPREPTLTFVKNDKTGAITATFA